MINFYGGPSGKSFEISWIFDTKTGAGNSMENDINMGWKSPISVGSYVVISYGEPVTENYLTLRDQDITNDGKNYNSTLWVKVYDENQNLYNGINYQLVMSMAGFTPRIDFTKPAVVLDADQNPDIETDLSNLDNPKITFKLPQSQILSMNKPITVLNADEMPDVEYDESDINSPVLTFKLPQSQRIKLGSVTFAKANEKPEVFLDTGNINEPVLNFTLPVSQVLQQGDINVLNADEEPRFEINDADPDKPILSFWLPQSQVMQDPGLIVLDSTQEPAIGYDDSNINAPKITFSLPRSVRFYYGDLLGERSESPYELTNEAFNEYRVGDFYINQATGFIYQVTRAEGTICEFTYRACIQQPLPEVRTTPIAPYTQESEQNQPKVVKHYTNEEETTWELEFQLPMIPTFDAQVSYIGPDEEGTVESSSTESNVTFSFKVPRGSKIFSGTTVNAKNLSAVVDDAKPGDVYLNTDTGDVYELQANKTWLLSQGNLKGPVGDALHVVKSYVTELEDTFDNGKRLITAEYTEADIRPDQIFAVTFQPPEAEEVAYWYFKAEDGNWGRVQLTGGISDIIKDVYTESPPESPVSNKTYSVNYVNSIVGGADDLNPERTAFNKQQSLDLVTWGTFSDLITP